MRNRAKCKLCGDIIESFHRNDYVSCSCQEISIDGGQHLFRCAAKSFENFLRVDDVGNERAIKFEEKSEEEYLSEPIRKPTKAEMIEMLEEMIANIEKLPANAMSAPITHYDWVSSLLLIASILKAD